jgi:hypothetical protein
LLPPRLRDEIARSLVTVRPLPSPGRRAAAVVPIAVVMLLCVPWIWRLREDALVLGTLRLWGGSLVQVGAAILLLATALAEAIPGRLRGPGTLLGRALIALAFMLALTAVTFAASPTHAPAVRQMAYARMCLTRSFSLGLVPLAAACLLLYRGLPARPVVAGALAGLAAGLLADASWRLFCEVSDPAHVLTAHAGAIAGVALAGALVGALYRFWKRLIPAAT